MTAPTLSVVMPVHNEAAHLSATIEALVEAVERSDFHVDLVLVDDGSTDGSAATVERVLAGRLPLQVVSQQNCGRFEARRAGLHQVGGEWVLLLDGRVRVHPESLAFVGGRLGTGQVVWTAHVHIDVAGNPYGTFQNVLTEIAWRDYFDDPREVSFGVNEFDRYPKGTTCLLVPAELIAAAVGAFRSVYSDVRNANDDTPLLRWVAARERVNLSPSFQCEYVARGTLGSFLRHSVHRGTVFFDGHGRRESRFFPLAVASFPLTAAAVGACGVRPRLAPMAAAATSLSAGVVAVRARRSRAEVASVAILAPVWAAAFGAGLWRGLGMYVAARVRDRVRAPAS